MDFKVGRFDNITSKVIPPEPPPHFFFLRSSSKKAKKKKKKKKNWSPLQSVKQKDFQYWVEASILIGNKEHLTAKGLENIKIIKNGMNKKKNKLRLD